MLWKVFDQTILTRFHPIYPDQVRATGSGKLLTVLAPVSEGHCNFTDARIAAAFDAHVDKTSAGGI